MTITTIEWNLAAKAAQAVAKKATAKKVAPLKTAQAPVRKLAKNTPTKKATVKAHPAQKVAKKLPPKKGGGQGTRQESREGTS
jgi:hypothetical protein